MKDRNFITRLEKAFEHASMADVARRLDVPHATVRNYYKEGRLPAPEVLIKIARETGVSLNWLLLGTGEMYAGEAGPVGLGRFLERKIEEMIDRRLEGRGPSPDAGHGQVRREFDVRTALSRLSSPEAVMREWLAFEGREYPTDFGVVFFNGWSSFSEDEKVEAIRDAKRAIDRVARHTG